MESNNFKMGHFDYEMTGVEVAEKVFLNEKTVYVVEKRALEKARKIFAEKGISLDDLL